MDHMSLIFLLLSLTAMNVQALPTGFPKCPGVGFEKNIGLIQKAVMIGGESRLAIEQYAADNHITVATAQRIFGATGIMDCGTKRGTIQLAGRNNLVIGVNHGFAKNPPKEKCTLADYSKCNVTFPLTGSTKIYKIKTGSIEFGGCGDKQDWSVFELDGEVPGVDAYGVPPMDDHAYPAGTAVLQVAAWADNFASTKTELKPSIKTYNFQNCQFRDRDIFENVILQTDCDTGAGASGAAQLANLNGRLTILAINNGEFPPNGLPGEYNRETHFNISIPLEGDFLRAIHRKLGTQISSE